MSEKILIIGAAGQIGTELTEALITKHGKENIITSDIKPSSFDASIQFEHIDATDAEQIVACVNKYGVTTIYLMAAMLSATGERIPMKAWDLNMTSLLHVLELAKEGIIKKIFWPSSIAVFGGTTPKELTNQITVTEPTTVYGISKLAGERWCEYYKKRYNVDVRSLRYPGIISWQTEPGGGTTDYAVAMFHEAVKHKSYTCYLEADTELPMMYMNDAIKATLDLMDAAVENLSTTSYNLASFSFTPDQLFNAVKKHIPEFELTYEVDFRQSIADSWPKSIDDSVARNDWNWSPSFDFEAMVKEMVMQLHQRYLAPS